MTPPWGPPALQGTQHQRASHRSVAAPWGTGGTFLVARECKWHLQGLRFSRPLTGRHLKKAVFLGRNRTAQAAVPAHVVTQGTKDKAHIWENVYQPPSPLPPPLCPRSPAVTWGSVFCCHLRLSPILLPSPFTWHCRSNTLHMSDQHRPSGTSVPVQTSPKHIPTPNVPHPL